MIPQSNLSAFKGHTPAEPAILQVELSYPADSTVVVSLIGEADLATAPELRQTLARAVAAERRRVIVDLDRLTFFDARTLDLLVEAHQEALAIGATLEVRCRNDLSRRILVAGGVEFLLERSEEPDVSHRRLEPAAD
ncbi:anti-anti-sigma factor [Nocardioides terrae]|uniref:Anti-anti-sigma factor n=1 Tax=Nocardioides terrae TaxID=574651 RepID=A0A1I1LHA4_9ACTN|nr:STAS domain-containing protein [Nocardioides terrae]SFC68890.1 anti-anti-sigma factor [Nocardioides terrae]